MFNTIHRFNTITSVVLLATCALALLVFGWDGSSWKALAIPTDSMRPSIMPGSLVLVRHVPDSSLKVGDVITHVYPLNPKITISHRIIKIYKLNGKAPVYITKGDANKVADLPIVNREILGKVVWHVSYLGWVVMDVKKPIVVLPIVYTAGLLVIVEEIQRMSAFYKRFTVYRLPGLERVKLQKRTNMFANQIGAVAAITTALILVGAAMAPTALAAIHNNTVSLTGNRITVAKSVETCSGHNSSAVTIGNTTNQTSGFGNAASNGGTATSGNASNSNSSSSTITITQCS